MFNLVLFDVFKIQIKAETRFAATPPFILYF
jgi:hypothetical protein